MILQNKCIAFPTLLFKISIFLFSLQILSQVGINTTDPKAALDVNGDLRIRKLSEGYGDYVITTDSEGMVSKVQTYLMYDANQVIAESPVDLDISGTQRMERIDLGLEVPVTIPAGKEAMIIVTYSVPMGTLPNSTPPNTYMGTTFFKENIEIPEGSRKLSIAYNASPASERISNMGTITNSYVEKFPVAANDLSVTYSVKGYVEQYTEASSAAYNYKFNMWQGSNANYNWGKASICYELYIK